MDPSSVLSPFPSALSVVKGREASGPAAGGEEGRHPCRVADVALAHPVVGGVHEGLAVGSAEELAAAVERVASGDAVFSPRLAGFVLDAFRSGERVGGDAELEELTPREREVLQLIARGYMYKEIAGRLSLSVKTVESHVSSVLRKLQLSTRHELTRWATEHRLV